MKLFKFLLVGLLVFVIMTGFGVYSGWQHYLTAMSLNDKIEAQVIANKSSYDNMWKSFVEMTQVTDKQAEAFKEVYQGLMDARYDDPNVLFKMVAEQNPQLDQTVYVKLQQRIESGRLQFNNDQKIVTDLVREYNGYIRRMFLMRAVTGMDAKDANDYIVTSAQTEKAFEEGEADVINLDGDGK